MTPPHAFTVEELISHREWLIRLARRMVRDPNDADDLAQDTLLAALTQHPTTLRRGTRPWLARVMQNKFRDRLRRRERAARRERLVAREESTSSTADLLSDASAFSELVQHVLDLDETKREIVLWHFFGEKSISDIARILDQPRSTVQSRLEVALAELRELLDRRQGKQGAQALLALLAAKPALSSGPAEPTSASAAASNAAIGVSGWTLGSLLLVGGAMVVGLSMRRSPSPEAQALHEATAQPVIEMATSRRPSEVARELPAVSHVEDANDAALGSQVAALEVSLVNPAGEPAEVTFVRIIDSTGGVQVIAETNADGVIRVEGLPTGPAYIEALQNPYPPVIHRLDVQHPTERASLTLGPGVAVEVFLDQRSLGPGRGLAAPKFTVAFQQSAQLPAPPYLLEQAAGQRFFGQRIGTQDSSRQPTRLGTWSVASTQAATAHLIWGSRLLQSRPVSLAADMLHGEVEFSIFGVSDWPAHAQVTGRIVSPDSSAGLGGVEVKLRAGNRVVRRQTTGADGAFAFDTLQPRAFAMSARDDRAGALEWIDLQAGAELDLGDVALRPEQLVALPLRSTSDTGPSQLTWATMIRPLENPECRFMLTQSTSVDDGNSIVVPRGNFSLSARAGKEIAVLSPIIAAADLAGGLPSVLEPLATVTFQSEATVDSGGWIRATPITHPADSAEIWLVGSGRDLTRRIRPGRYLFELFIGLGHEPIASVEVDLHPGGQRVEL